MSTGDVAPGESWLVTITGRDRPAIAKQMTEVLHSFGVGVIDVEQVRVHGQLLACVEISAGADSNLTTGLLRNALEKAVGGGELRIDISPAAEDEVFPEVAREQRQVVTVLAPRLDALALHGVFSTITGVGANIERIVRLATYPVVSYELVVAGGDPDQLRRDLGGAAARLSIDVAVQRMGLHLRAKRLIVVDADSTLFRGEVIDLLAERAGCAPEVSAVTDAAMRGEIEFADAMFQRLAMLRGITVEDLDAVARDLCLAPGARTLMRTLRRLGYVTAIVSGGFSRVIRPLADELGIDFVAANTLEVTDGVVTGRLVGPLVDRAGKAEALRTFAARAHVPLSQTVAVGDGANDLDMLALAGLGIAFNAKPVVREAADTALNVPYLDAILFLLGISRDEIEAADGEG